MAEGFLLGPDLLARTRRAIEAVEGGVARSGFRSAQPILEGDVASSPSPRVFRICTFSGAWNIGDTKTVTFKYQTQTPNTVAAINLFATIGTSTATRDCAIARDGSSWFLIAARCP